jgi:predicted nucleotidyltransferase
MTESNPLLKQLFSSNLRIKVLSHFYTHPGESFHVRGMASAVDEAAGTVGRELANLESVGIIHSARVGNQKHYSVDEKSPIHDELRNLFLKTTGVGAVIGSEIEKLDGIEIVFIYGSFASGEAHAASDIDLMIVGNISEKRLAPAMAHAERNLGRDVNYTLFRRGEVEERLGREGDFVNEVFTGPRIVLFGESDDRLFGTP